MIKKIEHTAIIVKNLEESIKFYEDILNLKLRAAGSNDTRKMAFLYVEDNPQVEIELIEELTNIGQLTDGVVDHLAFAIENMTEAMEELKIKGIEFLTEEPKLTIFGDKMILFRGINGELLQLIEK
ncbi:VOC family protein [Ureibacillus sp. NPDC094379]